MARDTVWLSREHRARVDAELGPRLERLGDRRVSLRPAPDTMVRLTTLLPVKEGVRAYATLRRDADSLRASGEERSRDQVMADLVVQRLTGRSVAVGTPIELELVMSTDSLVGDEPAQLAGYGPVPAPLARSWLSDPERKAPVWIRRLFAHPRTGQLIGMESRRRKFTQNQAKFLRLRDQSCRTPYCGAPIRHCDHIVPAEHGGPTSTGNGQGLCEACNYAKQAPGWRARPGPDGEITITTPTGHSYTSTAPDPPVGGRARSDLEYHTAEIIYIHAHPPAA
jgi:5-methylcytosine-specific restriction endonuclease McrA